MKHQFGIEIQLCVERSLDVLAAAQEWYERGSQLAVAVPALQVIRDAADPDAAFLACVTFE